MRNRFVHLALSTQHLTKVVVSLGEVRFVPESLAIMTDGLIEETPRFEGDSEVVVCAGRSGLQSDRFAKVANRLVGQPLLQEHRAEIDVSADVVGVECQGDAVLA